MRIYFSGEGGDHDVPERLCMARHTNKKPHVMLTFHNILNRHGNTGSRLQDFLKIAKPKRVP